MRSAITFGLSRSRKLAIRILASRQLEAPGPLFRSPLLAQGLFLRSLGGRSSTLSAMASSPRPHPTSQHSSSSLSSKPLNNLQTPLYVHWGGQRRQLGLASFWRSEVSSPSIPR